MKYLFGPVNSRRLGQSLGINLLPYKTCSFDCVYCECGATTVHTMERGELVPTQAVIDELDAYLSKQPELDWLTFSGSGEPTLHSGIGRIIAHLKAQHPLYRVAVLTNSSLLPDPEVRAALQLADLVIPTLNGANEKSFAAICRPVAGVTLDCIITGLKSFRAGYPGSLVVEVFIVPGVNDSNDEIEALRQILLDIGPDAVQLNELDRPGTEDWVVAPPLGYLETIRAKLAPLQVQLVPNRK